MFLEDVLQVKSNIHFSLLTSLPMPPFLHFLLFSFVFLYPRILLLPPSPSCYSVYFFHLFYLPYLVSSSSSSLLFSLTTVGASLYLSMLHSPVFHSPSLSQVAYAVNQNRFPWGMALNIILNFSFLISAASFTLNLLPRAKKQHGIHETCTHHRKYDYSQSISFSILLSHYPEQHGNRETCSHL